MLLKSITSRFASFYEENVFHPFLFVNNLEKVSFRKENLWNQNQLEIKIESFTKIKNWICEGNQSKIKTKQKREC